MNEFLMAMKLADFKMRNVKIAEFALPRRTIKLARGGGLPRRCRIIIEPITTNKKSPSD